MGLALFASNMDMQQDTVLMVKISQEVVTLEGEEVLEEEILEKDFWEEKKLMYFTSLHAYKIKYY